MVQNVDVILSTMNTVVVWDSLSSEGAWQKLYWHLSLLRQWHAEFIHNKSYQHWTLLCQWGGGWRRVRMWLSLVVEFWQVNFACLYQIRL